MPKDPVEIGRDVLAHLIELADAECDSLHDLADSIEGDPEEIEAYNDYKQRAEWALQAVLVARNILSDNPLPLYSTPNGLTKPPPTEGA